MKKTIEIYVKERVFDMMMTKEQTAQKLEYAKVLNLLIDHLHDSKVIQWIMRDLAQWQQQIIEGLVEEELP